MNKKILQSTLFLFMLLWTSLWGQQDPHISLYRYHMNMINPAVSGIKNAPFLNMSFRSQWQGFEGAPETQIISFGTPTKEERVGLGLNVIHDKTFVEDQTLIFGSFSYRLPLKEKLDLFLGIQAGTNGYSVNAQGLEVYGIADGQIDPNLINFSRFNPNVGIGAYLQHENYYFSLSAPKILTSRRYKEENGIFTTATDQVNYYLSEGSYFKINEQWEFIPSVLARFVNTAPFLITTNMSFSYKRAIDFGIEYNFSSGVGGTLMVETGKIFSFGYAYITSIHQEINTFSKGTHEVVMRIRLTSNKLTNSTLSSEKEFKLEQKIGTKNLNSNY